MLKKRVIKNISIEPPLKKIYSRLGYNFTRSRIDSKTKLVLDTLINEAFLLVESTVIWRICDFDRSENQIVVDSLEEYAIESRSIRDYLNNCTKLALCFATVGNALTKDCSKTEDTSSMLIKAVYDAVGSETADECMNWLHSYIRQTLISQRQLVMDQRFSPGYGDLCLDVQKLFYEHLTLQDHSVSITEKFFLIPEKSVTAFIGITGP